MAAISSNGTGGGNWGTGGTWAGGVAPVEGDTATIVLGDVVTVDGTYVVGADTGTSALTVTGKLSFSRSVNSSLQCKGDLTVTGATTATFDMGTSASPIPAGTTATLILNYSAAMANYKYGLIVNDTANATIYGETKTINALTTNSLAASGTTCNVDDATGWAAGDEIAWAATDGTYNHFDKKTISTITPGAGTTATITFAAVTYAHASGCPIINYTRNVTIKSYNTSNSAYINWRHTSTATNGRRGIDGCALRYISTNNSATTTTALFYCTNVTGIYDPFVECKNISLYNCNQGNGFMVYQQIATNFTCSNIGIFTDTASFTGSGFYPAASTNWTIDGMVIYYVEGPALKSNFGVGAQGMIVNNSKFWASQSGLNLDLGYITFNNCEMHTTKTVQPFVLVGGGIYYFNNCSFGGSDLVGTPTAYYIFHAAFTYGSTWQMLATDCNFGTPTNTFFFNIAIASSNSYLRIANKNLDPLIQEIWTPIGNIVRDNASKISGVTSLKMSPTSSTQALTFTLSIPAPTGNLVGVSGFINRDTANTATITLSGLGITPSIYTAAAAINTNETFAVSGTNSTGTDGLLTLTISVTGTSGNMWVDAVSAPQAAAIDFGEFGYWAGGLPANIVTASFVSALDVWNTLVTNISVPGSIGKQLKDFAKNVLKI